ncbi:MAG: ATP-dependent RNA helicase HrpA, partial [Dokdonella sp.]|nr:ATP-dependent RNA helicase HrpA [Dokdonella sp.]
MSELKALSAAIEGVLARDRGRLLARWRRLGALKGEPDAQEIAALRAEIEASRSRVAERIARVPTVRVDEALPIAARSEEIVALIEKHQVIVLAGETGSGKTTQLPKLCLAAGRGTRGMIACT